MKQAEIEKINKMIALQKQLEADEKLNRKRSAADQFDLASLQGHFQRYKGLSADEMQKRLNDESKPFLVCAHSKQEDPMHEAYLARFRGKPGYIAPTRTAQGQPIYAFPTKEEAASFFQEQAAKYTLFILTDTDTDHVIAFSNGDGKMYHPDGKEFGKQDPFTPSTTSWDTFIKRYPSLNNTHKLTQEQNTKSTPKKS